MEEDFIDTDIVDLASPELLGVEWVVRAVAIAVGDEVRCGLGSSRHRLHDGGAMDTLSLGLCVAERELVKEVHKSVDGRVRLFFDGFLIDNLGGQHVDRGVVVCLKR